MSVTNRPHSCSLSPGPANAQTSFRNASRLGQKTRSRAIVRVLAAWTSDWPSGVKATLGEVFGDLSADSSMIGGPIRLPLLTSQRRIVPSLTSEATVAPSGLNATSAP